MRPLLQNLYIRCVIHFKLATQPVWKALPISAKLFVIFFNNCPLSYSINNTYLYYRVFDVSN